MAVRARHHVNPFKKEFIGIAPPPLVLPLPGSGEPGEPPAELEVELGCADALFLFERARQHPGRSYVGVEIRRPFVEDVNQRARGEGLLGVRAVFAHIHHDLDALLAGHAVNRFYINFPDPWFKRAQRKRRLVTTELAGCLCALLRPGGELFFQSDIFDLALDAMAIFEATPGLRNRVGEWSFARKNPYGARSLREVRVEERGLPVWRLLYERPALPVPLAGSPPLVV